MASSRHDGPTHQPGGRGLRCADRRGRSARLQCIRRDILFAGIVSKQPGRNAIRLRSGNYSGTYARRFINNTVTGNVILHAATLNEGTLTLDGNQGPWIAAGNLMWGNSGDYELGLQISTSLHNNDIGT